MSTIEAAHILVISISQSINQIIFFISVLRKFRTRYSRIIFTYTVYGGRLLAFCCYCTDPVSSTRARSASAPVVCSYTHPSLMISFRSLLPPPSKCSLDKFTGTMQYV